MYDFQELFNELDQRIENESNVVKEKMTRDQKRKLNTENLALAIEKLLYDTMMNAKSKKGIIEDISGIKKYCGETLNESKHRWRVDDTKIQLMIDFSWSSNDPHAYKELRGIKTDKFYWDYLVELLLNDGICVSRDCSKEIIGSRSFIQGFLNTDILVITLEREKKKNQNVDLSLIKKLPENK